MFAADESGCPRETDLTITVLSLDIHQTLKKLPNTIDKKQENLFARLESLCLASANYDLRQVD